MHKNHGFRNVMLIMVVTELLFKLPIPYKNQISIRTRAPYDGASPHRKTNTWPQGKIIMSLRVTISFVRGNSNSCLAKTTNMKENMK